MIETVLCRLYDFLSLGMGTSPHEADCIFVLAGRQERKTFAIALWRRGLARELILSVGRFEWRRFSDLGLPDDGGLKKLVEQTPPVRRHFFVSLAEGTVTCHLIEKGRFGSQTEAQALATLHKNRSEGTLMVVSDPVHLRRVSFIFRRAFRNSPIQLSFVPVADSFNSIQRDSWWKVSETRSSVLREFCKYFLYRIIF